MLNDWLAKLKDLFSRASAALSLGTAWGRQHSELLLGVLGAAAAYYFTMGRRGAHPADKLAVELDAVAAKRQTASVLADKGAEAAHAHVQAAYATQLAALTERQRKDADRLKDSPVDLSAYLVRAGAGLGRDPGDKP